MKIKTPPNRRTFATEWDEIIYLYEKILYWLYQRESVAKARPYAGRLEKLLSKVASDHEAILDEECWALVYEIKGDLQKAIKHRENEIRLIRRLHELSRNTPCEKWMLEDYGYDDLSDRLDLLAILYHDSGELDKAIDVLKESKDLCEAHGLEFDGEEMLQEYLQEKKNEEATATK